MSTADNVIAGVTDAGTDPDAERDEHRWEFLANVQERQPTVWGLLCHCRLVIDEYTNDWGNVLLTRLGVYVPLEHWDLYLQYDESIKHTMATAACSVWGDGYNTVKQKIRVEQIIPIPAQLADFIAQNTARPMPRRYNSTAVQYTERDGIVWLTPPEVRLFDMLKEANWLFSPQVAFVRGDVRRITDFIVYWKGRHDKAVIVEVDSDAYHLPSQREDDEDRERRFQALGFQFLRFSAKQVLAEPLDVMKKITAFCEGRWGK